MYTSIFLDRLTIDYNREKICIVLHNPKYIQDSTILLNLEQKIYYSSPVQEVLNHGHPKNVANRLEKKHKNNKNFSVDRLDLRKYKDKLKTKSRSQIRINTDDLSADYSEITGSTSNANTSIIRSLKQVKPKKVLKVTQNYKPMAQKNNLGQLESETKSMQHAVPKEISIAGPIAVHELANAFSISETEMIKCLFLKGIPTTINAVLDIDTIKLLAQMYDFTVNISKQVSHKQEFNSTKLYDETHLLSLKRPPIVTVLGHVDHGKTTLLDTICKTNISRMEKGGITQTIYPYEVEINYKSSKEKIIFLDTPGHAAFSEMRATSAQITDIGLLVVAADDGLREQSVEIIKQLESNAISYVVAINKIDKQNANISKVKHELATMGVIGLEWGGNVCIVEISALANQNIDQLLNTIIALANSKNLTADPSTMATGTVLDSYINRTKGPIANVLIQQGTMQPGDLLVSGNNISKIRAIMMNNNKKVQKAGPSSVVEILGLSCILNSGDSFKTTKYEKFAKKELLNHNDKNVLLNKNNKIRKSYFSSNNNIMIYKSKYGSIQYKHINLILKTENEASINALLKLFENIPQKKVKINITSIAVGEITINDIKFASVSNSIVIGFNNSLNLNTRGEAERLGIIVKSFSIIYDISNYVRELMLNLVDIEYKESIIGHAIVKNLFTVSKGFVAGCIVVSGKLKQGGYIKVVRNKSVIYNGKLSSLKKVKEEVKEIYHKSECGVLSDNFNMWQEKDEIFAYDLTSQPKQL